MTAQLPVQRNTKRNLGKHIRYTLAQDRYELKNEGVLDRIEELVGILAYDHRKHLFYFSEQQIEWLHDHDYLIA